MVAPSGIGACGAAAGRAVAGIGTVSPSGPGPDGTAGGPPAKPPGGGASMVGASPAGRSETGGMVCRAGPGRAVGGGAGAGEGTGGGGGAPSRAASAAIAAAPASCSHCGGLRRNDVASTAPGTGRAAPAGLGSVRPPYVSSNCRTTSLTGIGGQRVLAPLSRAITSRTSLASDASSPALSTAQQT